MWAYWICGSVHADMCMRVCARGYVHVGMCTWVCARRRSPLLGTHPDETQPGQSLQGATPRRRPQDTHFCGRVRVCGCSAFGTPKCHTCVKALPTASVLTRILNRSASLATHRSHRPCRQCRTQSQQAVNTIAGAALLVAGRCRCALARGSDMPDPMHGSDSRGSLLSHIRSTARRPVRGVRCQSHALRCVTH